MMSQVQSSKYWKVASHLLASGFAAVALASVSLQARAVPELQLYIEGATYNSTSETWVIVGPGTFELWVIGNTGAKGPIIGVNLAAAVATSETGSISLSPTTTGSPLLFADLSVPGAPVPTSNAPSVDGAIPTLGDGSSLPSHGIYGAGTSFFEWELGDFTSLDSPIADFGGPLFPVSSTPNQAQINAYMVNVTGYTGVHFDVYGHYIKNNGDPQYINAPFSHDVAMIPEPEIYAMMLAGLGLMGFVARRRRQTHAAAA